MKGYMYMLRCANMELYVGSTNNLDLRLTEHHNGIGSNFTYKHLPIKLAYTEEFPTVQAAFNREQQIKKWSRAKKEALIVGDIERLKYLSKNHKEMQKKGIKKMDWKTDNDHSTDDLR